MRTGGNGWTTLALAVATGFLTSDKAVAGDSPRRDSSPAGSAPVRRIVVSLPDRALAVVEQETVVRVFPIAVGAPTTPSPVGTFTIVNRVENPTFYGRDQIIEPGPSNPVGTRWLGLSAKGYGIHGTDQPRSIGHARSHGCIRLRNSDIEQLFELVREGDIVEMRAERTAETARLFASPQSSVAVTVAAARAQGTTMVAQPAGGR